MYGELGLGLVQPLAIDEVSDDALGLQHSLALGPADEDALGLLHSLPMVATGDVAVGRLHSLSFDDVGVQALPFEVLLCLSLPLELAL